MYKTPFTPPFSGGTMFASTNAEMLSSEKNISLNQPRNTTFNNRDALLSGF